MRAIGRERVSIEQRDDRAMAYARAAWYASSMLENRFRKLARASKRHVIADRLSVGDV